MAAWLSLDAGDNDPALFWTYVIAALGTAAPGLGAGVSALFEAPQSVSSPELLTELLNDLAALERNVVLVLDDYHVIESREVHDGMAFLLDHMSPWLHLVIASRADPLLPLARLRARGELVEVRAADLRFTPEEASVYLTEVMDLPLTAQDVSTLESRTEGWIAALQLAALSMQGRDDRAAFVAGSAGDDRHIVDYLVEEVLQSQPESARAFLLQTSILARMNASLCNAVTGRGDGRLVLETLERSNLFLISLDDRRCWYRYHHLFAEVLQARLVDDWRVAMAELRQAQGNLDGVVHLLDEAEREYVSDLAPNVRPIPASRARVLLAQGRVPEALAWARGRVGAWAELVSGRRPQLPARVRARYSGQDSPRAAPAAARRTVAY